MYIENLRAKIVSGKNYLIKDENGERTGELGLMNVILMFDFKENNPLNNKMFPARLAQPKPDDPFLEEHEINGYQGLIDLSGLPFGADVLINAEIPLKNDFSDNIKLYDMQLV